MGRLDALDNFNPDYGYAYIWPWAEAPTVGRWAIAPGIDGPATVVVGAIGASSTALAYDLKALIRLIPQVEVDRARAASQATVHRWLDSARAAAGLPNHPGVAISVPTGFDPLPPAVAVVTSSAEVADHAGGIWWRAFKRSEECGRPADERAAFKQIARQWYKVRDQAKIERLAASTDLRAVMAAVNFRSRAEIGAMMLAGHSLPDWLECAKLLNSQDRDDEVLGLLNALIAAAEQEASISGREPASAYTERAAIIYRKHKDYASEIAVLERWDRFCPPARRGPGANQAKLLQRLTKARELAAKGAQ